MTCLICGTCGTQYADATEPPARCVICDDERQYVGWHGQTWTTHEELVAKHGARLEDDDGLLGIGLSPAFAINQRALFLPTDAGNILWECLSAVNDEAVAALNVRGGVDMIVISHPHFYSSMIEWSDALGGAPILLHRCDSMWVQRSSKAIRFWEGDVLRLSADVALIRCGGHFDGSTALHWARGPRPGGALFPSDAMQVAMDRRHVAFLYSYPNMIPMKASDVAAMEARLSPYSFEDVFGYTWGRNIIGNATRAVDASFRRHLAKAAA